MIKFFLILLTLTSCNKNNDRKIDENFIIDNKKEISIEINLVNGKNIFNGSCATCHLYGAGGSIQLKDKNQWNKIMQKKSLDEIYNNVLNGYVSESGYMPKKGACLNCSEQDLIDAVNYIFLSNGIIIKN
tara:strand:+ start:488 stop:877 length:390 start_codon:yes stop_codon:yes gene_type:complete